MLPLFNSKSVIVCHLSVATNHLSSFLRHDKSTTSFPTSLSKAARTARRRSCEKVDLGKRYEVIITYYAFYISLLNPF